MKKVTNSILLGLACTSILCVSVGVQSVKADAPHPLQAPHVINDTFKDFKYTSGNEFWRYQSIMVQANHLKHGYITEKTTEMLFEVDSYMPGEHFLIKDSKGKVVYNLPENLFPIYYLTLNKPLIVGETYTFENTSSTDDILSFTVVSSHSKISIPTINKVTNQDTKITGTGVPGATVHLNIAGDDYTGTVDASGKYNISLNRTYPVNSEISLYQEKDGIKSDSVSAKVVAEDHLEVPIINEVTNLDTQVTGTGVPGATIHLNIAGDNYKGIVDNQGNYNIHLNRMYPIGSFITIYQEKDGIRSDSVNLQVSKAEGLAIPKINKVTDKDTTVTGIGLPGATVHLTINGQNFHTVASANGQFSINIEKTYPVNTPIEVYQELNGSRSETIEVYVELTTPFIVNKIKSNATAITGTGHPNAQITVRIDDEDFSGTIDGNGNFSIDLHGAKFEVGTDVTFTVVSSEGTETKTVKIYPQDPIVGIVYSKDDDIRGTTDPGATVFITVGGEKYETVADSRGDFRQSVNPNLVVSGAVVTVYTSLNGLESDKVSVEVI